MEEKCNLNSLFTSDRTVKPNVPNGSSSLRDLKIEKELENKIYIKYDYNN